MIFGEGMFYYFYYKRQAEREKKRIEEMERMNPYLKLMRKRGRLVHLDMSNEEINSRIFRASGNVVCEECGKIYSEHPMVDNVIFYNEPYLYALCDGNLAKM